ncbi:hypothetical protein TWF788_001486 [Orbilia oligospora]|uniref:Uncharacterized protein n=1 Tax=Orbilia oligospora TaxID=2813651 RepID=A0A7C8TZJ9_ORBOL|nr:hypothetical protein TWF788_001486 [Orbilia oligospora]
MESQTKLSHEDYHVGWICALPKERTAASTMLDRTHPNLQVPANDQNTYTLGTVGKHSVVIACLPKGAIGTNEAATVIAQMFSTFSSIKIVLMVGIGGGIPPKVRLGDVVVGTEVIQWDFGKAEHNGVFKLTSKPKQPPRALLTVISELESGHDLGESKIPQYLDDIKAKFPPKVIAKWIEFLKTVFNLGNQSAGNDQISKPQKKPRDVNIHYGLIASGNQVIKDAKRRDGINKELDGNVLSQLDGKEDLEILNWITPIDYGPQHSDYLRRRQPGTGEWLLTSDEYNTWLRSKYVLFCPGIPGAGKTILTSIIIDNLITRFNSDSTVGIAYIYCNFNRSHEQKLDNLLASLLKQLAAQSQSALPDIVKELHKSHFARQTRPSDQDIISTLRSVIKTYSRVFVIVDALDEYPASNGRAKFLTELFHLHDKYGVNIFATSRFIPEITKIFECETMPESRATVEIRAHDEDVRNYLDGQISQLGDNLLEEYREHIKTEIANAARGIIQTYNSDSRNLATHVLSWITCARRALTTLELQHAMATEVNERQFDEDNIPEVNKMVSLCAGLITIDEESNIIRLVHYTTQEYFERTWVEWFPNAQTDITERCITYLLYDNILDENLDSFYSNGGGILKSKALRIYAVQNWGHHARISATEHTPLVSGLLENKVALLVCNDLMSWRGWGNFRETEGVHFAAYFGLWKSMTAMIGKGADLEIKDSTGRTPLHWAASEGHEVVTGVLVDNGADLEAKDDRGRTPLGWAVSERREVIVRLLVDKGANLETESDGRTPLGWALLGGYEAIVRLLVDKNVNLETKSDGWTPLGWAVSREYEAIVRLLVDKGANLEIESDGRTPLGWAVSRGYEAIVRLLVDKGANLEVESDGRTPLEWAVLGGHEAIVRLLINKGANLEVESDGRTLLGLAVSEGCEAIVRLLIDKGAKLEARDEDGRTALQLAAFRGKPVVVSVLIEKGAKLEAKDRNGKTLLHLAVEGGLSVSDNQEGVVRLLLDNGGDPDAEDKNGRTPLDLAVQLEKELEEELVEKVKNDGSDPETKLKQLRAVKSVLLEKMHQTRDEEVPA